MQTTVDRDWEEPVKTAQTFSSFYADDKRNYSADLRKDDRKLCELS